MLGNVEDIILCLGIGELIHNILLEQTLHCGISTHIMFFFWKGGKINCIANKLLLLYYTS